MCGLGYQITRAHRRPRQSSVCCTRLNPRSKADKRRVVPHLSSLEVDRVRRARACDNPTNERARTESWGGNCQQRQSRRCIAGCDGRCALPDSWGLASRFTSLVGTAVFATAMVLLYLASTLYHALPTGCAKRVLLKLDHGAIYLLIAGSYPPFTLGAAPGWWARVYRGRRILHAGFSVALRACRVAQLRRSRHRLSLLRGAGLLSMTLSSTPAHCPALVITMCNPGHPGWDQSARDCRCSTNAPVSRFLGTSGFGKA